MYHKATNNKPDGTQGEQDVCFRDTTTDRGAVKANTQSALSVECCDSEGVHTRPQECYRGKTYDEALTICRGLSLRLCTNLEIMSGVGAGKGCSQDGYHVWTSTKCFAPGVNGYTCADIDGNGQEFSESECVAPELFKKADLDTVTCAGATCASSDCCTTEAVGRMAASNKPDESQGPRTLCLPKTETSRFESFGFSQNQPLAVQCCDDGGVQSRPDCVSGVTWADASAACSDLGLRLCTETEVLGGGGRGKGCNFDSRHVWTSTVCTDLFQPPDYSLPDISFSSFQNKWTVTQAESSGAGKPKPSIENGVLTMIGERTPTARYRSAKVAVNMPEKLLKDSDTLVFVADIFMEDIVCPPESYKRPKMTIFAGDVTTTNGPGSPLSVISLDPDAVGFSFTTGIALPNYKNKILQVDAASDGTRKMTFEFAIWHCEGKMTVSTPRLLTEVPKDLPGHPYPDVVDSEVTVNINSATAKPWNPQLFGANSQFCFSEIGGYETDEVKNLLDVIKIPELRFPGGKSSNYYDWRTDRMFAGNDALGGYTRQDPGRAKNANEGFTWHFEDYCNSMNKNNGAGILVFNIIPDNAVTESVERLKNRKACGLKIDYVELGNENMYRVQASSYVCLIHFGTKLPRNNFKTFASIHAL